MNPPGPALPANWYLLGRSADLRPGRTASHSIGDREIIVYREELSGIAHAFAGHCAHMGCHLGGAEVVGDKLRCPLHHRLISPDGSFLSAGSHFGPGLKQQSYKTREYLGCLWIYLGPDGHGETATPMDGEGYRVRFAGEHHFPIGWSALVANGFDVEHLASVHERRLLETPSLKRLDHDRMELRYRTRPTGRSVADRAMARLSPDGVKGCITSLSGSMMLVESEVGRHRSFILLSFLPGKVGDTLIRGIVGVRSQARVTGPLLAWAAVLLFKSFLRKDLGVLEGLRWHEPEHPQSLGDKFTRQLCDYFRELRHA